MNFLAIDASTEACSVAIKYNGNVYSQYELCPQSHSLRLLPMVDALLKEAECKLTDLDALIYGQGPGSFTGVRIGIGVAQGLAFSAELPVIGVSTMQCMAQQAYEEHNVSEVFVAIDARMSEVYNGYYQHNGNNEMLLVNAETVLPPETVPTHHDNISWPVYGVGSGWDAYPNDLAGLKTNKESPEILYPHAKYLLTLGALAFERGEQQSAEHAQPVYVRDTVSWKKLPGRE